LEGVSFCPEKLAVIGVHWDGVRAKTRGKKYPKGKKLVVIKKLKKTFRNRVYRAYLLS
jgi:hypothetical protein